MKRKRLGEILIEAGAITHQQLAEALEDQKRYGGKLGTILLDRRFITEDEYFRALTAQLKIPAVDFTKSTIPEAVIKIISQDMADQYNVFPVALKQTPQGRVLVLAMSDPTNVEVQDQIRFTTGYKVEPVLALDSTIRYVIRDYFFHFNGKGSYRLESEIEAPPPGENDSDEMQIEYAETARPHQPELLTQPPEEADGKSEDKPNLSRELKALLKILAKKGLLTPQEYYDEFKDTD